MGTEFLPKDYLTLLKCDIPNGRDDLISTSKTLEDVAEHCLNIYDKSLETTVNYTAQALGSVAYKINLLATNFLEVLDHQNIKLNELQTKVNHLNMQVHIHQEKTARLSIGKYTMPRDPNAMRSLKTIEPLTEINSKYKRKEIDFTILDHIGHGVKEPQLGGSSGIFSNTSRRSSTSGSDTHSSTHAYSQSNLAATLGPKTGSEYTNKFGKIQTIGRTTGIGMNNPGPAIYRAPGTLSQKSQIPMVSPNLSTSNGMATQVAPNYGNTMQYQQQMSQTGPRRSNSTASSATSGSSSTVQSSQIQQAQKQYQASQGGMVSPHKMSVGSLSGTGATGAYGYPGVAGHPMAHIPPPPPPVMPTQNEQNMMRYNEFPPPPIEPPSPYQHQPQQQQQQQQHHQNMGVLPPPPSVEQFQQPQTIQSLQRAANVASEQISVAGQGPEKAQNSSNTRYMSDSVGIAHLQPNPYDVVRPRNASDEPWAPAQYICKVVTLYEYQQNKDDELSFQENELIFVVKKNNDGWWEGVMNGRTGLFPGNYVQNVN